jgi:hypothetical protein
MTGQGRLGDYTSDPYRIDQIVPADDVLAVLRQVNQQVENLGRSGNDLGGPKEFSPVQVEHAVIKHQ